MSASESPAQSPPFPLLILDSHPVQYKAPVYRELARLRPGLAKVVYWSDCSVRGYQDKDFGQKITWDTPLLEGYAYQVLGNERGIPLSGFRSLTARGVWALLRRERPRAVIISQFLYEADFAALAFTRLLGIPIWIRHETQDQAQARSTFSRRRRALIYRVLYAQLAGAFYIGQLSREHLQRHGFRAEQLIRAPYCVQTPLPALSLSERQTFRDSQRRKWSVAEGDFVILFSGKLIEKKNPRLLLEAVRILPETLLRRSRLVFLGTGVLQAELEAIARNLPVPVLFAGFINQTELPACYLAGDLLVLPSRRMGETWGLVVNEALHAGCAVALSNAAGSHREFQGWERVRVFSDGDTRGCSEAINELSHFPRSLDWCEPQMEQFSVRAAAEGIASAFT